MNAFALNRCPTYTFVILESSSSIDRVPLLSVVEHLLVKGMIRALSPFACALLIDFISVRSVHGGKVAKGTEQKALQTACL